MAFTRQQVLEMQQKLASLGYKDTDFEILAVEDIGGEEWVAVVDGGVNKRMLLGNFEQYIITKDIPDLDEIRQNAASGATAYHMPDGGIPRSDLSGNVQASLSRADRAVQPSALQRALNAKQDKLDSGVNIRTINGESVLGAGDIFVGDGLAEVDVIIKADANVQAKKIWSGTEEEYNALTPSNDTIYFIKE